ncbi:MAG: hypothetical protein A3F13_01755 [Gammaproteobacteria bacterium RIFCSPHIGHO2_12_FULL_40_19]|nr:MAG: hypothetical protein A3F13_01755 [Gammaproteobacteria bacterium RIFCSPHIGHO2_12_FULL_40_19]
MSRTYNFCLMRSDSTLEADKLYIGLSDDADRKSLTYSVIGPDGTTIFKNIALSGYSGSIPTELTAETLKQLDQTQILQITSAAGHTTAQSALSPPPPRRTFVRPNRGGSSSSSAQAPTATPASSHWTTDALKRDEVKQLVQMMLEARLSFLKKHVGFLAQQEDLKDLPVLTLPDQKKDQPIDQYLKAQIEALTNHLKKIEEDTNDQTLKNYIAAVKIDKKGENAAFISRNLFEQFAQLNLDNDSKDPHVSLTTQGAKLYWKTLGNRDHFYDILSAHGIPAEKLDQDYRDNNPEQFPESRYSVAIPHLHVEALFELAQYHPYNLVPTVGDWYAAKKLNRHTLLTGEVIEQSKKQINFPQEKFEIEFLGATRAHLNNKDDLVTVTIAAEVEPTPDHSPHVVILFDDSGSMRGDKINAANAALKKFVMGLDPNTLVSIQPFNTSTAADRRKAFELQKMVQLGKPLDWCSMLADGTTPLHAALASSAVFLRENRSTLTISADAIRNTTIVLLTDGQPNDTTATATATAENAVVGMKTTSGFGAQLLRLRSRMLHQKIICLMD